MGSNKLIIFRNSRISLFANLNLLRYRSIIFSAIEIRSSLVYRLKSTTESKRRIRALSKCSYKFVVAMMTMSVLIRSNPFSMAEVARPISRKSLGFVRSKAMASISSNKIINFSGWENPLISLNSSDKFFCV